MDDEKSFREFKRLFVAALAMHAQLSRVPYDVKAVSPDELAAASIAIADALIAKLEQS